MNRYKMTKLGPGWYRVEGSKIFANIHKGFESRGELTSKWYADLRNSETGKLLRMGGIWDTRNEAYIEMKWIMGEW